MPSPMNKEHGGFVNVSTNPRFLSHKTKKKERKKEERKGGKERGGKKRKRQKWGKKKGK